MLLRDSEVARQVRVYLLDMEYLPRTQPVDNPVHAGDVSLDDRIDQRITHILGKTVVPMFNALIETSGEHRRELVALRAGVQRIERRLHQHHIRLQRLDGTREDRPTVGAMAATGAPTSSFKETAASTSSRSRPTGGASSPNASRFSPYLAITSPEVQKFVGSAKVLYGAEVALFVATCPFTPDALSIASEAGITAVHRGLLEQWSTGEPLKFLK
jgi:hypothetical protein